MAWLLLAETLHISITYLERSAQIVHDGDRFRSELLPMGSRLSDFSLYMHFKDSSCAVRPKFVQGPIGGLHSRCQLCNELLLGVQSQPQRPRFDGSETQKMAACCIMCSLFGHQVDYIFPDPLLRYFFTLYNSIPHPPTRGSGVNFWSFTFFNIDFRFLQSVKRAHADISIYYACTILNARFSC